MRKQDFYFELPKALIANHPLPQRSSSRLLQLNGVDGDIVHGQFTDLVEQLHAGDLLVFNNTKVIPARMFGLKSSGGKVEVLVERVSSDTEFIAQIRASKASASGTQIQLLNRDGTASPYRIEVTGRDGSFYTAKVCSHSCAEIMAATGHMPLPPYIERDDSSDDFERYQTVYAEQAGAVAAPTAGLHFDESILAQLAAKGVSSAYVTLHVGAGTFQPLRVDDVRDHVMHKEWLEVSPAVCEQIHATVARGGRIIAVGTTAVRCLETAAASGTLQAYRGDTQLFITPGYRFNVVDAMVTNFHLPESTLIMLVAAFAGKDHVMQAYNAAIEQQYRFFSYGDAMFIQGQHASTLRQPYV